MKVLAEAEPGGAAEDAGPGRSMRRGPLVLVLLALAATAFGLALHARFHGLGSRTLAEDEYYSARSVQLILEKGVPELPTGGYYTRALPLQYLQALSVRLLGDNEGAHRLPAALFGLLALFLFYSYAKQFVPRALALAATACLALSSWEIEFSRFGRMYTLLQLLTIAFLYSFYLAYSRNLRSFRYVPHLLALSAIVVHSLGVFLLPLLFAPLFMGAGGEGPCLGPRPKRAFALVSLFTLLAGVAYYKVDTSLMDAGVSDKYPEALPVVQKPFAAADAVFPFFAAGANPLLVLAIAGMLAGLASCIILIRHRGDLSCAAIPLGLSLLFISAALHLFAVFFIVLAVLIGRYDFHRRLLADRKTAWLFALACLLLGSWTAVALLDRSWANELFPGDFAKALRVAFFVVPDVYIPGVRVWLDSMPFLALVLGACVGLELLRVRKQPWAAVVTSPAFILAYVLVMLGIFTPLFSPTTRYWFFVYPLFLLSAARALHEALARASFRLPAARRVRSGALGAVLLGALFGLSEDFNLPQILRPASPEVAFRTGRYQKLERHWYHRWDERTPARYLNEHRAAPNAVIVSGRLAAIAYYLESDLRFAWYFPQDALYPRFLYKSRERGKTELWTGFPLLGTPEALEAHIGGLTSFYLVRFVDPARWELDPAQFWGARLLGSERVSLGEDGRIEVLRITLAEREG
jgi:hypothetical protein